VTPADIAKAARDGLLKTFPDPAYRGKRCRPRQLYRPSDVEAWAPGAKAAQTGEQDGETHLSLDKAARFCRKRGRRMSVATLIKAINSRGLPAYTDPLRCDRRGQPRLLIYRGDLERFVDSPLVPYAPATETALRAKRSQK
jgi:hypothetical protein